MSRLLWIGGWAGVAVWSLLAFAAYGFVDLAGGLAMRNADAFSTDPETVEWIFSAFGWVRNASSAIVLVVWGLVSLAILSVPWLFDRLTAGTQVRPAVRPPPPGAPRRDGVIDLDPGDYTVVREPGRTGAVPRVGPRG